MNNKITIIKRIELSIRRCRRVSKLIEKNGMGLIEGRFRLQCYGTITSSPYTDWGGKYGDIVVAHAIQVAPRCTIVYIDGNAYNSVGFF